MDLFDVTRPEHLGDDGWAAVESALNRLRLAQQLQDLPEVVGKAKELVETVANVVVAAADGTLTDNANFVPTVKAAQAALKRQPGVGLSQDGRAAGDYASDTDYGNEPGAAAQQLRDRSRLGARAGCVGGDGNSHARGRTGLVSVGAAAPWASSC